MIKRIIPCDAQAFHAWPKTQVTKRNLIYLCHYQGTKEYLGQVSYQYVENCWCYRHKDGSLFIVRISVSLKIVSVLVSPTQWMCFQIKDIQVPNTVQFIEMMSEGVCVGYPSAFAIYSVQGDAAPIGKPKSFSSFPFKGK